MQLQYRLEVKHRWPVCGVSVGRGRTDRLRLGPVSTSISGSRPSVGVECEGFDYHGGRLVWKRDKRRTAWIEAQGWRLVVVTWDDVTQRPDETTFRIKLALGIPCAM